MNCIGLFDSGVGGLGLFKKLIRLLPRTSICYLADTAHLPYGEKKPEEILSRSLECASILTSHGVQNLVIACYSASALAAPDICSRIALPVFSVVDSLVQVMANVVDVESVALLGTRATIHSQVISDKLSLLRPDIKLFPLACPELVRCVEQGAFDAAQHFLDQLKSTLISHSVDTVLLACTHYPLLIPLMTEVWSGQFKIIDPTSFFAQQIAKQFPSSEEGMAQYSFMTTGDPTSFQLSAQRILGFSPLVQFTYLTSVRAKHQPSFP